MKPTDKRLDRIKKLLALSKSPNPQEAELAAQRAAELMTRWQIDEAALGEFDAEDGVGEFTIDEAGQLTHWQARAAYAAAAAFGGELYANGTYDQEIVNGKLKEKRRVRLQFIGKKRDLSAVQYMYQYFSTEIRRLTDEAWECRKAMADVMGRKESARTWKDSFRKGCASRIYTRIKTARANEKETYAVEQVMSGGDETALARVDAYEKAVQDHLGTINTTQTGSQASDDSAYRSGWRAGGDVSTGTAQDGGRLKAPAKQIAQ